MIDTREVQQAEWIKLDKIADDNNDDNEIKLYPAPFITLSTIKPLLKALIAKHGKEITNDQLKEILSTQTLSCIKQSASDGRQFNYYTPKI